MQISLNQAELEVGVKMFIQSRGIDLTGRDLDMDFTQVRKGQDAGVNVEVDLGEDSHYIPEQLSTPTSPSSVTLVPNRNGGFSARRMPQVQEAQIDETKVGVTSANQAGSELAETVEPPHEDKANISVETSEDGRKELVMEDDDSTPDQKPQEAFAQEEEQFEDPNVWYHKPETKEVWEEPETTRRKGIYKVSEDTAYRLIDKYAAEKEQAEEEAVSQEEIQAEGAPASEPEYQEEPEPESQSESEDKDPPFNPFASPASEVESPKAPTSSPFGGMETEDTKPMQPAPKAPSLFGNG